jgi:hypothetical protein
MTRWLSGWRSAIRRGPGAALAVLLTAGVLTVAGCGTAPATGPGSAPRHPRHYRTVCAAAAALTRVVAVHTPSLTALSALPPSEIKVKVSDPSRVRALARAVCALPDLPVGVYQCPLNTAGGYELTFALAQHRYPPVSVESGGCEVVRGVGHVRWAARDQWFWRTLSRSTGIASPFHRPWLIRRS